MNSQKKIKFSSLKYRALANAIRTLAIDAIDKANSGHPGMPLGMADVTTVLFSEFLRYSATQPNWINRDRFVLSAGHGAMLQYAAMYLAGYETITLDDIKNFRQKDSITSGHPENILLDGVDTSTGPLGQGIANAVGMAIAEKFLHSKNKEIDYKTYVVAGDGCLMEGISHEAASLAGHLQLNKLILLYDSNDISIDGPTSLTFTDNVKKRFEAYNWNHILIDGHSFDEIHVALTKAQNTNKPTIIECKTKIGFGSPNKEGTEKAHGSPFGKEESLKTKQNLGINDTKPFSIEPEILSCWRREFNNIGSPKEIKLDYLDKYLEVFSKIKRNFLYEEKSQATRVSSQKILEHILEQDSFMIGGSADLGGSNGVLTKNTKAINKKDFSGNYLYFGVREHAMSAILNGIALSGIKTFGSTFLAFIDYMKPAVRLSALMKLPVVYLLTHDSIGLGEDGPTHQPVEHLANLRSMPNILTFRPADYVETTECWEIALKSQKSTSALCLSRQNLPQIRQKFSTDNLSEKGAYIISESKGELKVTIFATGSEVSLALEVQTELETNNIGTRVISIPCFELFDMQEKKYKMDLLCNTSLKVGIEAATKFGWEKYIGSHGLFFGVSEFGMSAPKEDIYEHFGLTMNKITKKIKQRIKDSDVC